MKKGLTWVQSFRKSVNRSIKLAATWLKWLRKKLKSGCENIWQAAVRADRMKRPKRLRILNDLKMHNLILDLLSTNINSHLFVFWGHAWMSDKMNCIRQRFIKILVSKSGRRCKNHHIVGFMPDRRMQFHFFKQFYRYIYLYV